jgi:hypothetical protein
MSRLKIHLAVFGGTDFTKDVQDLVKADQTLEFSTKWPVWQHCYGWRDPWPGTTKSVVILYQWDQRPLELVVTSEYQGTVVLDPTVPVSPSRTIFLNPACGGEISKTFQIFAIIWGRMEGQSRTVPASIYSSVKATGFFTPSNDFFGFDGYPGETKTALVIYQLGEGTNAGGIRWAYAVEYGPDGRIPAHN